MTDRPTEPDRAGSTATSSGSTALLDVLLAPLDPGYAAAAERRGATDRPPRRRWDAPIVAVGCALIGFTLVIAYVHQNQGAPEAAKVHDALVSRVRAAEANADALDARAQALNTQITSQRASALAGDPGARTAELVGGVLAADGPGLTVTLGDPPDTTATPSPGTRPGTTPPDSQDRFTDRDVRAVVNELWHDGAEAVAVNGVRLTPTSAIRLAGQAVLVDFRPLNSPYSVQAIGNSDGLLTAFAGSDTASRFQTVAQARGGAFSVAQDSHLQLPARALAPLQYARPVTGGPR